MCCLCCPKAHAKFESLVLFAFLRVLFDIFCNVEIMSLFWLFSLFLRPFVRVWAIPNAQIGKLGEAARSLKFDRRAQSMSQWPKWPKLGQITPKSKNAIGEHNSRAQSMSQCPNWPKLGAMIQKSKNAVGGQKSKIWQTHLIDLPMSKMTKTRPIEPKIKKTQSEDGNLNFDRIVWASVDVQNSQNSANCANSSKNTLLRRQNS